MSGRADTTLRLASGAEVWAPTRGWQPRVVAVDEDGTFLRDHVTYDRGRLEAIWPALTAANCRFVVATGNQHWQVRDLFAAHADEIAIVSSNGSHVVDSGDQPVFVAEAQPEAVAAVIDEAHRLAGRVALLMSGERSAYVERTAPREFVQTLSTFFHRIETVGNFSQVDDRIFMFSTLVDERECRAWMAHFDELCQGALRSVYSGDGYLDLVVPGVNKAAGLAMLCERWGVDAADVAAFGDSENDLEMLRWAGAGYAMDNAADVVKATANGVAPANTDDGVLQLLEAWFPPTDQ